MENINSDRVGKLFSNSYSRVLVDFVDSVLMGEDSVQALFLEIEQLFISVLGLTEASSSFAVFESNKVYYNDKFDTSYIKSSVVSLDEIEAILMAISELLNNPESSASPFIFTAAEIKSAISGNAVATIPCSVLAVPIYSPSAIYGYAIVFYHNIAEHYAVDSPQVDFLAAALHIISLIYEMRLTNKRLDHYLLNDALTELPNRSYLYEAIANSLQTSEVYGTRFALMIVRVNGLKSINNSLGIITGDIMLKEMGALIKSAVTSLDVLVGRLSGSDFVVLVMLPVIDDNENGNNKEDERIVRECCESIIEKTKNHVEINSYKLYLSANIGASISPQHGETAEELLKKADLAKSAAKQDGLNSYRIYEDSMAGGAEKALFLNSNLPAAIASNQFELFYQAQIDIKTGAVVGAEALIRWRHPERGLIYPGDFVLFAENNGFNLSIDALVLQMACEQINIWRGKDLNLSVSVNISPKHFANGLIYDTVSKVLNSTQTPASNLKLELLESTLLDDFGATVRVIKDLRELGVAIALDDFGSGYSSLEYVAKLPMDYLKIDRNFSMQLGGNPSNKIILETIMTLARGIGVQTIAEGVESQFQFDFLHSIGCDIAQGYFINKPMPVHEFEELLEQRNLKSLFLKGREFCK